MGGAKKRATKAELGHAKVGAKLEKAPKFLREVRIKDDSELPEVGIALNPAEVFQPGDIVDVIGVSKGKGFAGGVKRYGFRGGPKTHGQSDRHRAPGSIGQGTTPGRVYKGKRMAGNMGNDNVTVRGLMVVDVTNDGVLVIKGLVPGVINGLIKINKTGTDKKFVPLFKDPEVVAAEEKALAEAQAKEAVVEVAEVPVEEPKEEEEVEVSENTETPVVEEVKKESVEEVKDGDK
jgi:large subunit ribosomal protein L3